MAYKIKLILLAGGNSKRFDGNKLLYQFEGKPLYRHTLDKLIEVTKQCKDVMVYVVSQYKQITDYITSLNDERITSGLFEDCGLGASYSIRHAVEQYDEVEYNCFFVADQPNLKLETILNFLRNSLKENKSVSCLAYQDQLLNPVMFSKSLNDELLELENDQGGKKVAKRHLDDCYKYFIDDLNEVNDIDFKDDIDSVH